MSAHTMKAQRHTTKQQKKKSMKKPTSNERQLATEMPKLGFADRLRLRFGQGGATTIAVGVRIALYSAALVISWVTALAVAVRLVPDVIGMILSSIEIPQGAPVEQLVISWVIPALFVAGLLLVVLWTVLRLLWRGTHRLAQRVHHRLTADPSTL